MLVSMVDSWVGATEWKSSKSADKDGKGNGNGSGDPCLDPVMHKLKPSGLLCTIHIFLEGLAMPWTLPVVWFALKETGCPACVCCSGRSSMVDCECTTPLVMLELRGCGGRRCESCPQLS
jgi:hypothetical protein